MKKVRHNVYETKHKTLTSYTFTRSVYVYDVKGLQAIAKYTITCFSGNGQRMRTNIMVIGTRP